MSLTSFLKAKLFKKFYTCYPGAKRLTKKTEEGETYDWQ